MIQLPTVEQLFEAGAHFGHQKANSHPKSKNALFTIIKGVHIINLDTARIQIEAASSFAKNQAALGKRFLLVGTKRQAKEAIEAMGKELATAYITNKWLGGTLTNFETIKSNLKKLEQLESQVADPSFGQKSKKFQSSINSQIARMHRDLDGIKGLDTLPDVMIVVDTCQEKTAVTEAHKLDIPVIGLVDTNADPTLVDYPIQVNDDSSNTVSLVLKTLAAAISEGRKMIKPTPQAEPVATKDTPVKA